MLQRPGVLAQALELALQVVEVAALVDDDLDASVARALLGRVVRLARPRLGVSLHLQARRIDPAIGAARQLGDRRCRRLSRLRRRHLGGRRRRGRATAP